MISHFFIDRPIFASVLSIVVVAGGRRGGLLAAGGPVSRRDPADGAGHGAVPGRQCPDRPRHGRRADRGAGQRRREHDVHVLAVHQRRRVYADGDLPAGHGFGHGPGPGAEPRLAGPAGDPGPGPARGDQRQEDVAEHDDDRQPRLARTALRRHLPEQLRDDRDQGRAGPVAGRGRRHLPGPARLQHAGLARPRQAGGAQPDGDGRGQRHRPAEPPGRRRPDRPAARAPSGQQFQLTINTLGRLDRPRAIRRHHPQGRRAVDAGGHTTHLGAAAGGRAPAARPGRGGPGQPRSGRLDVADHASSGSATSPASSWARSSTTSPARSTASPPSRCRSTSSPARTPWIPRAASTRRWRS